jgi:hypothetical protein
MSSLRGRKLPGDLNFAFVLRGRWYRMFAGLTFKPKVARYSRFHGHRLWALRLWPVAPGWWRIIGFQTRQDGPRLAEADTPDAICRGFAVRMRGLEALHRKHAQRIETAWNRRNQAASLVARPPGTGGNLGEPAGTFAGTFGPRWPEVGPDSAGAEPLPATPQLGAGDLRGIARKADGP